VPIRHFGHEFAISFSWNELCGDTGPTTTGAGAATDPVYKPRVLAFTKREPQAPVTRCFDSCFRQTSTKLELLASPSLSREHQRKKL
jgi:hypothetical protein